MENGLVYAVDDEASIRKLIEESLTFGGFSVRTAAGKAGLETLMKQKKPDIILLDIMLQGDDGYAILTRLKNDVETADVPVIMLSAKGTEEDKVQGLNLGADDYITKPFGVHELIARIKANLRKTERPRALTYKDIRALESRRKVYIANIPITLTRTEFNLLAYFLKHVNETVSKKDLLSTIWGIEDVKITRTVDIHMLHLKKKLKTSQAELDTVWGVGYILR